MSATGLDVFDRTLQKAHIWLNDIQDRLGLKNKRHAYIALRAVLHALRDRLTAEEAVHLGAQLPMIIRGFYYDGWNPSRTPERIRSKEEFVAHVPRYFVDRTDLDPERVVSAVFGLLSQRISEGEMEDVKGILPEKIRGLWPPGER